MRARGGRASLRWAGPRVHALKRLCLPALPTWLTLVQPLPNPHPPSPETFLRAAELIGVPPQHCVGYEDAPLGMQAIKAAGFLAAIDVTKMEAYPLIVDEEEEEA